ncbi:hypothetical protein [Thalassoglobus polymorphus]|uniref:Uncharacterized protein n=1 Tax=Thalassoglobus polymorphus TaxID=2527994 RepID=A0A517QS07_9PLAN|nr:hypothetical protein [Thalassoglobus polymorphus]QDT34408.1 hypothetical protein Mal48_36680 [Thalassoglobus polymorphus]
MTELRQIPYEMLPKRSDEPNPLVVLLVMLVIGGVGYGSYSAVKYIYVNFGSSVSEEDIVPEEGSGSSDIAQQNSHQPLQESNAPQAEQVQATRSEQLLDRTDREKAKREIAFSNGAMWWGDRILKSFVGMGVSLLAAMIGLGIFMNCMTGLHNSVPAVFALFMLFVIAVIWPWIYFFFF